MQNNGMDIQFNHTHTDRRNTMKHRFNIHLMILAAAFMLLLGAGQAFAGGTASGEDVTNQATLDYTVNSISQGQKNSNSVTFKVDKKVDLTVVQQDNNALVEVTPGATSQVLTFLVTNTGNDTQDISLSAIAQADGTVNVFGSTVTDNFADNTTGLGIFVESGANSGYQSAEDTATYIDELTADGYKTVYIVRDIESTLADGDIAVFSLVGQVTAGGTGGSKGAALTQTNSGSVADDMVDTLFADVAGSDDAANDAKDSDRSGFKVVTATMTADKTQSIAGGYAIPGATVTYTIAVDNAGSAAATSVVITDDIPNFTTYKAFTTCNGTQAWSTNYGTNWVTTEPALADVTTVRCTIATIAGSGTDSVAFQVTID